MGHCHLREKSPHQGRQVAIATGHGDTYKELETPTKVHGIVGACFSGMWNEPALAKHLPTYSEFNLVATAILTVYNEAAKNAGLGSRMCKCTSIRIYHNKGDKDDWRSGLAAPPPMTYASSSSKRPQPPQEDQEGKRHRESARSSHQTEPPASQWDWDWSWQSWTWQGYGQDTQSWPRQYR